MTLSLIWTRANADWPEDSQLLAKISYPLIRLPCLMLEALPLVLPETLPQHFVVTSANAVRFALAEKRLAEAWRQGATLYTHGRRTMMLLKQLGFTVQLIEVRTAAELGEDLARRLPPETALAVIVPEKPAYDLNAALSTKGYKTIELICYRTLARLTWPVTTAAAAADGAKTQEYERKLSSVEKQQLQENLKGIVCFASPSAIEGFAAALSPEENRLGRELTAAVIGPTTAKAAAPYFKKIIEAPDASISTLLNLATRHLQQSKID